MKRMIPLLLLFPLASGGAESSGFRLPPRWSTYFAGEISNIEAQGLASVSDLEQWEGRKEERRRELAEMLGLWPTPERTDLKPVVTGVLQGQGFTVEKVQFQASPQLYVTGNLYLPAKREGRLPGILYVCGHSRVVTNGVSCGNKTAYQQHGAWFARNGFACLIIDTLQYGEILGAHRGTYSDGQWWWNSRGYTPAGVEAWFGIRALDYLCSRPEVDPARIGMTGRSGGGAYTWTVAALDDRVKVAAPVAGMTDLRNQVLDERVDGHCDCMFQVNTYRWDFPMIGALIAPRPLLICNTDKDHLFPLDGVLRTHEQIRRIYDLYGATKDLGLIITEGDHKDSPELQVPVFHWFVRYLKPAQQGAADASPQDYTAPKFFAPEQLRVFQKLPADEKNTTAAEWFNLHPAEFSARTTDTEALRQRLMEKTFAGWPTNPPSGDLVASGSSLKSGEVRISPYELAIQPGITQRLCAITLATPRRPRHITLVIADEALFKILQPGEQQQPDVARVASELGRIAPGNDGTVHIFVPRAVGDPSVSTEKDLTRLRRRFMLVGQTLDGMRVWDIRCAVTALRHTYGDLPVTLVASGPMAVNASYAALFQPEVRHLDLKDLPHDPKQMPDYLNVSLVVDGIPGPLVSP